VNVGEACDVLIVARWLGWGDQLVTIDDAVAAESLVNLMMTAAKRAEINVDAQAADVIAAFEAHCARLHGTAEAEQVCELVDRQFMHDGKTIATPALLAAVDRWKATRAVT
jgi:hypothetical protein